MKKENDCLTSAPKPETHLVIQAIQNSLMAVAVRGPWRDLVTLVYKGAFGRSLNADKNNIIESEMAAQIRERGFSLGAKLPDTLTNRVREFALAGNQQVYINPHLICDSIAEIVNDEKVLQVVEQYLGVHKICCCSKLWWNNPEHSEKTYSQGECGEIGSNTPFHYDLSDFQSLALFVYISDVDNASGPHEIIEGSHRDRSLKRYWCRAISEHEAHEKFPGKLVKFVGPAGTSFFEDVSCYHRRSQHDMSKVRLVLSAHYHLLGRPATA
ncbi:MAG: hypothetical protein V3V22_06735 [Methylococcales bacterium]